MHQALCHAGFQCAAELQMLNTELPEHALRSLASDDDQPVECGIVVKRCRSLCKALHDSFCGAGLVVFFTCGKRMTLPAQQLLCLLCGLLRTSSPPSM